MIFRPRSMFIGITVLAVALGLLGGCGKKKAEKKIEEAVAVRAMADGQQMSTYMPTQYKRAANLISQAESSKEAKDYEGSMSQADSAMAAFDAALTQLPELRDQIEKLWTQLDETLNTVDGHLATAEAEGVVPSEEIETLRGEVFDLKERTDDSVKKPERNGSVDRTFLSTAITDLQTLEAKTVLVSVAHLKPKADEAIAAVTAKWEEAQTVDAEQYKPDAYAAAKTSVETIQTAYTGQDWQTVIDGGDSLVTSLDTLLNETRIAASDAKVQEAEALVKGALQLQAPDVADYGTFLTDAQAALNRAREAQNQGQAAQAFSGAEEATALVEEANAALGAAVGTLLKDAEASLQEAVKKEARTYAASVFSNAEGLLSNAQTALGDSNFAAAYQGARAAKAASAKAAVEAEAGKARSLLSKVENRLKKLATQGARERAGETYGAAQNKISALQRALEAGQYQQVGDGVGDADSSIDLVRGAMSAAAAKAIQETDGAIKRAELALEETRATDDGSKRAISAARRSREEAASALESEKFGTAFSKTKASVTQAADAEMEAYVSGADRELSKAKALVALAREASAPSESPAAYRKALDLDKATGQALDAGQGKSAYLRSLEAHRAAQEALDNLIILAGTAIDDAREAQATVYEPDSLRKAESLFNQARDAHTRQAYEEANRIAKQVAVVAADAESFAWRQRSTALLAELVATQAALTLHDTPNRAPSCWVRFNSHATKGRAAHVGRAWEEAYAEADAADQAAEDAWKGMDAVIDSRLDTTRTLFAEAAGIADDPSEKEALDLLTAGIEPVLTVQALKDYNAAYTLSAVIVENAETYLSDLEWQNREQAADRLADLLDEKRDSGSANVMATESDSLEAFLDELRDDESEASYATLMTQVGAWDARLGDMPERSLLSATERLDAISALLDTARENGAKSLYRARLRELEGDYNQTRNAVHGQDERGVADRLMELEEDARDLVDASDLAKREEEYKTLVSIYLDQMAKLLSDFGRIASLNKEILTTARATTTTVDDAVKDAYRSMQPKLTARAFRRNAELLEQNVRADAPPKTLKKLHALISKSAENLRLAAEGFEYFGNTRYELHYRSRRMEGAYKYLEASLKINEEIEFILDSTPETTWKVKWDNRATLLRKEFWNALYGELDFKTDRAENDLFHFIFNVKDVARQARSRQER